MNILQQKAGFPSIEDLRHPALRLAVWLSMTSLLWMFITSTSAAQNGGNDGGGKGAGASNPPPAVPTAATPGTGFAGSTVEITITGTPLTNEGYYTMLPQSPHQIRAAFSGSGITVQQVTVISSTSLTLMATISAAAPTGDHTITITNPDGQFVTSLLPLLRITDRPSVTAARITPSPASTIDDLHARVTDLQNLDPLEIGFTYQWLEDGNDTGYRGALLPAGMTTDGHHYSCVVTPVKAGIAGTPCTTPPVAVSSDSDRNGIHDQWELDYFQGYGIDPGEDSDGDGVDNRTEYLFGLNPHDRRSRHMVTAPLNAVTGLFRYTRSSLPLPGLQYRIWMSQDLAHWQEVTTIMERTVDNNDRSETVEILLSEATGLPRCFVRISAETP